MRGSAELAARLEKRLPKETVALREVAVWIYERLVAHLPLFEEDS